MKRHLLIALTVTLFCFKAFSQEDEGLRLAIVLSPQVSWMSTDHEQVTSKGNLMGYNFGIIMDNFFAPNYALTSGLTINSSGGKLHYNPGIPVMEIGGENKTNVTDVTYDLKYIEIPIGIKLITNDFRRSRYYAQFGLYSQFNIQARNGDKKAIGDDINFFEMGYNLGGGIEYSLGGSTYLTAGLLYNNGFMDVTNHSGIDDKATLNRVTIQFGIIF